MIEREEGVTYIATISGGKDSVTMCDLLLKNGYPVDYIVFTDTLQELPIMYEYIEKLKKYFFERYSKKITILNPESTFEEWCFGKIQSGENKGKIRGIPIITSPCYWRRESKVKPMDKFQKDFKKVIKYIGFTKEENRSVKDNEKETFIYPLKNIFKMTEEDCKQYLINQEMENPIYRFLTRSGCGICPFQSIKAWFEIWKNEKQTWYYMRNIERKLELLESYGYEILNKHWFVGYKKTLDMEKQFIKADKQGSLFDFSDEPVKDCFCKI